MSVAVRSTPRVSDSITMDLILGKPIVPYKMSRSLSTLLRNAYRGNSSHLPRRWGLLATMGLGKKKLNRIVSRSTTVAGVDSVINTVVSENQIHKEMSKESESGVKSLELLRGLCNL